MRTVQFNKQEILGLLFTTVVVSFILSFTKWGISSFDAKIGLQNLLTTAFIVIVSLFAKLALQKHHLHKIGVETTYAPWISGLLLGFVAVFATNGKLIFLSLGALGYVMVEKLRIGKHAAEIDYTLLAWILFLGPVANVLIALVAKALLLATQSQIFADVIIINLWIVFFTILPLPYMDGLKKTGTSDGLKMLFSAPLEYFISVALVVLSMYSILFMSLRNAVYITLGSVVVMYLVYFFFYKQNLYVPKTRKTRHYTP